jgi:acetate kinase
MSLGTKTSCVRVVMIPTNEEIVIVSGPAPSPPGYALGTE